MLGAINVDTISDFTPPTPAGLFFCLASAEGAGLLFLPDGVQATYKRLQHVLCSPCSYITHAAKQRTGLHSGVSVNLTHSSAHNTAATQAAYTPPVPRWRAYRQALHLHQYPDTSTTPDAVQLKTAAYYNKVYKSAAVRLLWIHARRCNIQQTMPARRGTTGGSRRSSFRAFAR